MKIPHRRIQSRQLEVAARAVLIYDLFDQRPRMLESQPPPDGKTGEFAQRDLGQVEDTLSVLRGAEQVGRPLQKGVVQVAEEGHRVDDRPRQSRHSWRRARISFSARRASILPRSSPRRLFLPRRRRTPSWVYRTRTTSPSFRWCFSRSRFGRVIYPLEPTVAAVARSGLGRVSKWSLPEVKPPPAFGPDRPHGRSRENGRALSGFRGARPRGGRAASRAPFLSVGRGSPSSRRPPIMKCDR